MSLMRQFTLNRKDICYEASESGLYEKSGCSVVELLTGKKSQADFRSDVPFSVVIPALGGCIYKIIA